MTDKPLNIPEEQEKTPPRGRVLTPFNPDMKPPRSGDDRFDKILERLDDLPELRRDSLEIRRELQELRNDRAQFHRVLLSQASFLHAKIAEDELDQVEEVEGEQRGAVVLVVEDERPLRRVLCRVVQLAQMQAISAADAFEAERILQNTEVDVAIVDINLPGGRSGLVLAQTIREHYRNVGCVIVTGMLTQEDAIVCKELGVRVFEKPLDNEALLGAIKAAYAGRTSLGPPDSGD